MSDNTTFDPTTWRSWETDPPAGSDRVEVKHSEWSDDKSYFSSPCYKFANPSSWLWRPRAQPSPPKVVVTEEMVHAATKKYWRALGDVEDGVRAALEAVAPMIAEQVRK